MTDEWLRAATTDDNLVADLLLRLKESDLHPSAFSRQAGAVVAALLASLPPFDWGKRFPRSRNLTSVSPSPGKKDRERTRRSPTTPLSWSAGGGGSGVSPSNSCDDSSRPSDRSFSTVRSKGTAVNETTTSTTGIKRPRRKKTFAELKEEESSLIKDRAHLRKELDALRIKLEEQRSLNQKLKKTKLDLQPQLELKRSDKEASMEKPCFVLPDLNMEPEEDCLPAKITEMR